MTPAELGEIGRSVGRRRQKSIRAGTVAATSRRSAGTSNRSSFRTWPRRRPPSERIKAGTTFAAIAAERGLKEQDIDLGTVPKSADHRSGRRRCRLRAQAGRGERADPGPFRRRHRHRARASSRRTSKPLADRGAVQIRNDLALRTRQDRGAGASTTRSRTSAPAAARWKRRRRS